MTRAEGPNDSHHTILELAIFIGLQGAGKSSFYHSHLAQTHVHVSKDNFRNAHNRDKRQRQLIEAAFAQNLSVAVDNTNASRSERAPCIEMGRAAGAQIVGYFFEARLSDCKARNAKREGIARVPDVALHLTSARLQLPKQAEGFDALFFVRLIPIGFEITPWREPA